MVPGPPCVRFDLAGGRYGQAPRGGDLNLIPLPNLRRKYINDIIFNSRLLLCASRKPTLAIAMRGAGGACANGPKAGSRNHDPSRFGRAGDVARISENKRWPRRPGTTAHGSGRAASCPGQHGSRARRASPGREKHGRERSAPGLAHGRAGATCCRDATALGQDGKRTCARRCRERGTGSGTAEDAVGRPRSRTRGRAT